VRYSPDMIYCHCTGSHSSPQTLRGKPDTLPLSGLSRRRISGPPNTGYKPMRQAGPGLVVPAPAPEEAPPQHPNQARRETSEALTGRFSAGTQGVTQACGGVTRACGGVTQACGGVPGTQTQRVPHPRKP